MLPRTRSRWLLKISNGEDSTNPQGSPCRSASWCLDGTCWVPVCARCLLALGTTKKRLTPLCTHPSGIYTSLSDVLCLKGMLLARAQLHVHEGSQSFSESSSPAGRSPACPGVWSCSFSGAGLRTSPCQTPWGSFQPVSPICQGPKWHHEPLVHLPLLCDFCHQQSCWGCTLSIIQIIKENGNPTHAI